MATVKPVDMSGEGDGPSSPRGPDAPKDPPPSRGGGGFFTFLLAAAALGLGVYVVYDLKLARKVIEDLPDPTGLLDQYVDGSIEDSVLDQVGALELRIAELEGKNARMEEIIEHVSQEIGSSLGISEGRSSIPLYSVRIVLADMRLRSTGDPSLVVGELRALLPFIPEREESLLDLLEADIELLSSLPSREDLLLMLDEAGELLENPLRAEGGGELEAEGALGFLYDLAQARRALPAEEANLLSARAGVRNARTLALVGDSENYARQVRSVREDVEAFGALYPEEARARLGEILGALEDLGLPAYGLSAAATAWDAGT